VPTNRAREFSHAGPTSSRYLLNSNFRFLLLNLAVLSLFVPRFARAQDSSSLLPDGNEISIERKIPPKPPVESELVVEGLASYGNYRIFAAGWDMKLYTAEVEYDRHSWGYFLGARMDYAAEVLPMILLNQPRDVTIWGNPGPGILGKPRIIVPGVGIEPIGLRMMWLSKHKWKPYLTCKGGMIVFDQKAPSSQESYENFSMEQSFGVQVKMTPRLDLRLGLFGDFHFSNAYITPVNPGLDVMNANMGLSYQLGRRNSAGAE
jgi:hypothetical protein